MSSNSGTRDVVDQCRYTIIIKLVGIVIIMCNGIKIAVVIHCTCV